MRRRNTDEQLRRLEREARVEPSDSGARSRLLVADLRAGRLPPQFVRLAALLGDEDATIASGVVADPYLSSGFQEPESMSAWVNTLARAVAFRAPLPREQPYGREGQTRAIVPGAWLAATVAAGSVMLMERPELDCRHLRKEVDVLRRIVGDMLAEVLRVIAGAELDRALVERLFVESDAVFDRVRHAMIVPGMEALPDAAAAVATLAQIIQTPRQTTTALNMVRDMLNASVRVVSNGDAPHMALMSDWHELSRRVREQMIHALTRVQTRRNPHFLDSTDSAIKWALENVGDAREDYPPGGSSRAVSHRMRKEMDVETYVAEYHDVMRAGHARIWRAVEIPKGEDPRLWIDWDEVGTHWSFRRSGAGVYSGGKVQGPTETVAIEAVVQADAIDWEYGFTSFWYYGEDQFECALLPGARVEVVAIDGAKTSDLAAKANPVANSDERRRALERQVAAQGDPLARRALAANLLRTDPLAAEPFVTGSQDFDLVFRWWQAMLQMGLADARDPAPGGSGAVNYCDSHMVGDRGFIQWAHTEAYLRSIAMGVPRLQAHEVSFWGWKYRRFANSLSLMTAGRHHAGGVRVWQAVADIADDWFGGGQDAVVAVWAQGLVTCVRHRTRYDPSQWPGGSPPECLHCERVGGPTLLHAGIVRRCGAGYDAGTWPTATVEVDDRNVPGWRNPNSHGFMVDEVARVVGECSA